YTAGDFSSACQMVDGNTPLEWLVRDYVLPHGQRCFVITDGLRPQGIADLEQIQQVPRGSWGWTPVRQIMTPLHQIKPIQSAEPAYSALERMVSERRSALPVVDGNRLLGLVRQDHLLRFAQMQSSAR
ncbi:MAG TPA: CBS domain-containing protein, partial [Anaerolineae bacterium]|nr:CBS domain-containing protein [Anaerolineae bacterium]